MRNSLKILHSLLVWGMVPLVVWSGFPSVGCACETVKADVVSCGCCGPDKAPAKPCCCRRAAENSEPRPSSARSVHSPTDVGLLANCGCERGSSPAIVAGEWERKSADENLISGDAEVFAALQPDRPWDKPALASVSCADADRVILFCALLI